MEKFAGYGFNKSHSASYALIAYQTAWLKTHFPAAFMSAVLSTDMDRTEKIIILLTECETLKLHVSPPDINKSQYFFEVLDDKNIAYGLGAIKGVGEAAIENIIVARNATGPFKNLFDFCERVDLKKINKRVFEALIKSGCFDSLGQHRASLLASLNNALQCAEQKNHNQTSGQFDLLSLAMPATTPQYIDVAVWSANIQLQGEKETLGFYLTGHPLNQYLNELTHFTSCRISELSPSQHQTARVAGIIANIRVKQTKRGDRIGIFTLDDGTSQMEVVCFSEAFQKYRALLVEDQIIVVDGDVSVDEFSNGVRLVARDLCTMDEARAKFVKYVRIDVLGEEQFDMNHLKSLLSKYIGGSCPVIFRYIRDNIHADIKLGQSWFINPTDDLIATLAQLAAIQKVEVEY
jgi:DNA polymerase-3 subunit alpha